MQDQPEQVPDIRGDERAPFDTGHSLTGQQHRDGDHRHNREEEQVSCDDLRRDLEAIRAQRQWLPNKERSRITAKALEGLAEAMERAPDATAIRAMAMDVAVRTLEENSAWFGLMRFQDLEPR